VPRLDRLVGLDNRWVETPWRHGRSAISTKSHRRIHSVPSRCPLAFICCRANSPGRYSYSGSPGYQRVLARNRTGPVEIEQIDSVVVDQVMSAQISATTSSPVRP
jgi:hypothetical protein